MSIKIRPSVVASLSSSQRAELLMQLEKRTVRIPWSGCWVFTGYVFNSGYGGLRVRGTPGNDKYFVHRLSYELLIGAVPDGKQLDHLCRVRCCLNPAHLEPVTHRENVLRGISLPKAWKTWRSRTHCNHGHAFDENNTILTKQGHRRCRICQNFYSKLSHAQSRSNGH